MAREKNNDTPSTSAQHLAGIIKSCRYIMRKDKGLNGDLDRLPMLTWILFLKFLDDTEKIREVEAEYSGKKFVPSIEFPYRWRDWASFEDGITGSDLISFINQEKAMRPDGTEGPGLFNYLQSLKGENTGDRKDVIATIFRGTVNRMISGYLLRDVINKINGINFTKTGEIHTLSQLYESMLKEMRDAAGDSGEFYTPRSVVKFIVEVIDPKIGEIVLDPACGTGGFLVEAYEHLKKKEKTIEDYEIIQKSSLFGGEAKTLPYLLCQMNLLLHGLEYPQIDPENSLRFPLREIGDADRVDVIITNPPFGGEEERGILDNFPNDKQTSETALLFIQLIMRKLRKKVGKRDGGRCGIVVPNGTLFGDGICAKIKEELMKELNLHTIIRLPKGVFAPYADIESNLLFFEQGEQTKEVWYYQVPLPEGRKNYTKTKPMKFEEFLPVIAWWKNRKENEHAWVVSAKDIAKNNFNLDIKNPHAETGKQLMSPEEVTKLVLDNELHILKIIEEIKKDIAQAWRHEEYSHFVKLSSLISPSREKIEIDPFQVYSQITIRLHHKGVALREEKMGQLIKSKQYKAKSGQFIISRIDARNGAMGLIPPELDGAVVTNDFLLYNINEHQIHPRYFDYITSTSKFMNECIKASKGTTNRVRLNPTLFLEIKIPLPSLEEQQRIISIFEKVDKVKLLQEKTEQDTQKFIPCILQKAFSG